MRHKTIRFIAAVLILETCIFGIARAQGVYTGEVSAETASDAKTLQREQAIFKDVPEGNNYFTAVQYMKKAELIDDSGEYFDPGKQISRAEAIYYIFKIILGYEPEKKLLTQKPFNDVPKDGVLTPYITKAIELKIINGYPNNLFKPQKKVILAETVKMTLETERLINSSITFEKPAENVFTDVPANVWFSEHAKTAKDKRIIKFDRDDKMEPSQIVTKGYLTEILYRLLRSRERIMFGIASFYGGKFNGRKTSSGDVFSSNLLTAAHRTLPFGTKIRVTNLRNSKSVDVVVNDRGPYTKNFTLDLSESAFATIAPLSNGVIPIEYKIME